MNPSKALGLPPASEPWKVRHGLLATAYMAWTIYGLVWFTRFSVVPLRIYDFCGDTDIYEGIMVDALGEVGLCGSLLALAVWMVRRAKA